MSATPADAAAPTRLPTRLLAPFAAASMPVAALGLPLSVYLPNYYVSHIGLSLGAVGAAFSIVRLIDIVFDPLIGIAINATHTRFGRFRPWMVAGAPLLMLATYMMFMAEPGASTLYMVGWLLVLYAGFSMVVLGHASWAAALVPEYHQRSRVYGWMQAVGVVSVMVVLALPAIMAAFFHKSSAVGVQSMGWYIIAVSPLTILLCTAVVGEPKRLEAIQSVTLRDYWIMLVRPSLMRILLSDLALALGPAITGALYIFFFTQALGFTHTQTTVLLLIYIAAGLPGAPTWALIAQRLGKHQTVMLGCVLYGFAQAVVFFAPQGNMAFMIPAMFVAGFVVSCFAFLIRAMVADISDEVRLEMGKDRTALLYGLITSTSKVGSALATITTFSILSVFGFNGKEGVVNTGIPLDALEACYVVVPILTMFVGAAALWGYKLDQKSHDGIRKQLASRDAISGAAGVTESLTGSEPPLGTAPALQIAAGD
jgi:Na+/melibiose symporter-like transporter